MLELEEVVKQSAEIAFEIRISCEAPVFCQAKSRRCHGASISSIHIAALKRQPLLAHRRRILPIFLGNFTPDFIKEQQGRS